MKSPDSKNNESIGTGPTLVLGLLIFLGLYLIFKGGQHIKKPHPQQTQTDFSSKIPRAQQKEKIISSLNESLKEIHIQRLHKSVLSEEELNKQNPEALQQYQPRPEDRINDAQYPYGLILNGENKAQEVLKDLEQNAPDYEMTPGDRISRLQAREKWNKDFDQANEQAQIQEILDRAAAQGLALQLDEDLNIISIKEIKPGLYRTPQSVPSPKGKSAK